MFYLFQICWLVLVTTFTVSTFSSSVVARRVRVRPRPIDEQPESDQVQYYTAPEEADARVLLVPADEYQIPQVYARSRAGTESEYRRPQPVTQPRATKLKESPKQPPVQTIRNYSKVNDDGSFTFGYEAADGSFKEETRGTDCVVRGKYGYVDPDGNKREFTYVSGNPCDPNAVPEQENQELPDNNEEENIPRVPIRPLRPTSRPPRPSTTLFQQNYIQDDIQEPDDEIVPDYRSRAQPLPRPTPAPQSVRITPRPAPPPPKPKTQLPATTYRPQLLAITPRPSVAYAKPTVSSAPIDYNAEYRKFQLENNVASTPRPVTSTNSPHRGSPKPRPLVQQQSIPQRQLSSDPVYETQLVYDPSNGQYNTVLYQQLPQTNGELNLHQRLQPYVTQQQPYVAQQQIYQQQQANIVSQSQQLYASQQARQRALQESQQARPAPQQFYYVTPQPHSVGRESSISNGQIDAFLRGHNIAF